MNNCLEKGLSYKQKIRLCDSPIFLCVYKLSKIIEAWYVELKKLPLQNLLAAVSKLV